MEGLDAVDNVRSPCGLVSGELFPVVIVNKFDLMLWPFANLQCSGQYLFGNFMVIQLRDFSSAPQPVLVDISFHRNRVGSQQNF